MAEALRDGDLIVAINDVRERSQFLIDQASEAGLASRLRFGCCDVLDAVAAGLVPTHPDYSTSLARRCASSSAVIDPDFLSP